jgi:hypothetical protein
MAKPIKFRMKEPSIKIVNRSLKEEFNKGKLSQLKDEKKWLQSVNKWIIEARLSKINEEIKELEGKNEN